MSSQNNSIITNLMVRMKHKQKKYEHFSILFCSVFCGSLYVDIVEKGIL